MNGFDGTLMSSINAMPTFHEHFGTRMQGSGTGILFSIYAIGNLAGALVAAPAADTFGRRFGMFIGSLIIIVGTILEASAPKVAQFIGGRFLIGMGISISNTSAPIYLVEGHYVRPHIDHIPFIADDFSAACTWIAYGTGFMDTNWSWRLPVVIQAAPSVVVLAVAFFMPESPRWLFANNKPEEARQMLIKYHGNNNPESALVAHECREIEEGIRFETSSAKPSRYFMPVMLENAGITSSTQQLLLNALNTVFSFIGGLFGSCFVDRWGRRTLFLYGTFITGLIYIPINVISSYDADSLTTSMGYGFIACIFLYGIVFSFSWTPLQALYPAEILPSRVRAKGMAFQNVVYGGSNFINMYATPTGMDNIGWRMYIIFRKYYFQYADEKTG
ncbi:unnamed protein product [Aspergillus oryzae]|uniref:Unnamed protein product n=1 Tax=Aspergillus oryzae var. brunneus TaxID=332754 RepID=A0ABQ6K9N6_ASPOZ|nr:unnamed protein product [Aspergillus oryzae]GMF86295.1 unnamed protein product [Aspergillus oryzae]GMG02570.1 unnamed protein product [Aspergillus oryzae]GMG41057.1 unnamed protein product [Aspergillus oryzae var. brunneus]